MFRAAALLPLLLAACNTSQAGEPALTARIAQLMADVRAGDAAFQAAAQEADRLAAAAGPAQSESWIEAQQAISALVAARAPVAKAIADLDELAATRLAA